jgi:hypothetical protein
MLGLVLNGLSDMICRKYGINVWKQILSNSGVEIDVKETLNAPFITHGSYNDAIIYKILNAIQQVLHLKPEAVLEILGKDFTTVSLKKSFPQVLYYLGDSFMDVVLNFENLHTNVKHE